jgi:hypothetical protein
MAKYMQSCHEYQKNNVAMHKAYRLFQAFEFAYILGVSFEMDFITDLALTDRTKLVWVRLAHFTKIEDFILLKIYEKSTKNLVLIVIYKI